MSLSGRNGSARSVEWFVGGGGSSRGLHLAGFEALELVDKEPSVAATLGAAGFPASRIRIEDIARAAETSPSADLLWASPPCQPASRAGKRGGRGDSRSAFDAFLEALEILRRRGVLPPLLLVENVVGQNEHDADCKGSCPGCDWESLERVVAEFYPSTSTRALRSADYGVPQHRNRLFLCGSPRPFAWPTPSHSLESLASAKWVTGDYWTRHRIAPSSEGSMNQAEQRALTDGAKSPLLPWVTVRDALPDLVRSRSGRVVHERSESPLAGSEPWRLDLPSTVVAATDEKGTNYTKGMTTKRRTPMRASDTIYLATGIRRPTVDELAILQTFPSGAKFSGSVHQQYIQVGNAVPVVLAKALGLALREMIR